MGTRLVDNRESRCALPRHQNKRFLDSYEFHVHEVGRIRREEIDGARSAMAVIVRFYFRTRLGFQMRQIGKMRMNESAALMIAACMQMEHRPIHDCEQQ